MNDGTRELVKSTASQIRVLRMRVEGPGGSRMFALSSSLMTLGRHRTNHIVVDDPNVSGVHLEVHVHDDGVTVRDMRTTNGTWLGPHRIQEARLAVGAVLRVGESTVHIEVTAEAAPTAAKLPTQFGSLQGASQAMGELFQMATRIAARDLTVLIQGETGTGKEELARALHAASPRAHHPFIVIDATTIPDAIAESVLFGYEKGAFTGATERKEGFFEAAQQGTVFIDEVGELSPSIQAKFLRVLERKEVVRVGAQAPTPINVRIVAATHRDLRLDIEQGRFREDLYFRLAHVRLFLPPLRDRTEDIPMLASAFLRAASPEQTFSAEALDHLRSLHFPGNVRELRSIVERASALGTDAVITPNLFASDTTARVGQEREPLDVLGTFADAKERTLTRFEKAYLSFLMRRTKGNLSKASRESGLARHYLRELLRKRELYDIEWNDEES